MRARSLRVLALIAAAVTAFVVVMPFSFSDPEEADAAVASNFDPGYIISDANFYNGSAMSSTQVQSFLNEQQPGCRSGYTCLNRYSQSTPAMSADRYCDALTASSNATAAQIIARVGDACGISQRALIVLLQKEQSLVTSTAPSSYQYNSATGFACPDTAPCDSSFGGFFYQVYYAARQFEVYRLNPGSFNYRAGQNNTILWHPNSACGTSTVNIRNQATAGLYIYTPYRPNAAALANLYGTGDSCSTYGNRNFWRMWTDWFGDPTGGGSPTGNFESASIRGNTVTVKGWAIDPDTASSIQVHVYAGGGYQTGTLEAVFTASSPRADVERAYPTLGANHGFSTSLTVPSGTDRICAYAIDSSGASANRLLGCRDLDPKAGSPFGRIDGVTVDGAVATFRGWAIDPDTTGSVTVHAYVGGRYGEGGTFAARFTANTSRPDVGSAYPGSGNNHGFNGSVTLAGGTTEVCLYAINAASAGTNVFIGCRDVTTSGGPPQGNFESVTGAEGSLTVRGWIIDPDTRSSVEYAVTIDGTAVGTFAADSTRADVGRNNPGYGDEHGFSQSIAATAGTHNVCITAVNVGEGTNRNLGCRTVTVSGGSPQGNFESVRVDAGSITVRGWIVDPDTTAAVQYRVTLDGTTIGTFSDSTARADVGRLFPGFGDGHGFATSFAASVGTHTVCVTAIDVGAGSDRSLGCRTVTVEGGPPFGNFEAATPNAAGTHAAIRGWAIDLDTTEPIRVHVYVNGTIVSMPMASGTRADVARSFPLQGEDVGFTANVPLQPGANTICVYAINVPTGVNPSLGCRVVTV